MAGCFDRSVRPELVLNLLSSHSHAAVETEEADKKRQLRIPRHFRHQRVRRGFRDGWPASPDVREQELRNFLSGVDFPASMVTRPFPAQADHEPASWRRPTPRHRRLCRLRLR